MPTLFQHLKTYLIVDTKCCRCCAGRQNTATLSSRTSSLLLQTSLRQDSLSNPTVADPIPGSDFGTPLGGADLDPLSETAAARAVAASAAAVPASGVGAASGVGGTSGIGGVGIDDEYAAVLGGADLELLSENAVASDADAAADTDDAGAVFAAAVVGENRERLSEAAAANALAAVGESAVSETPAVDCGAEVFAAVVVGANRERLSEAAAANALASVAETPASKAASGMPAAAKPDVAAAAAMAVSTEYTLQSAAEREGGYEGDVADVAATHPVDAARVYTTQAAAAAAPSGAFASALGDADVDHFDPAAAASALRELEGSDGNEYAAPAAADKAGITPVDTGAVVASIGGGMAPAYSGYAGDADEPRSAAGADTTDTATLGAATTAAAAAATATAVMSVRTAAVAPRGSGYSADADEPVAVSGASDMLPADDATGPAAPAAGSGITATSAAAGSGIAAAGSGIAAASAAKVLSTATAADPLSTVAPADDSLSTAAAADDSLSGGAAAPSVVGVPTLAAIGAGVVGNSAAGKSSDEAMSTPTRPRVAAMASGFTDSLRFSGARPSILGFFFGLLIRVGTGARGSAVLLHCSLEECLSS